MYVSMRKGDREGAGGYSHIGRHLPSPSSGSFIEDFASFAILWLNIYIFFSIMSRAFYYCLTCHADVKYPELIKECECSRGTKMHYK